MTLLFNGANSTLGEIAAIDSLMLYYNLLKFGGIANSPLFSASLDIPWRSISG